jgi:hypothetical protein
MFKKSDNSLVSLGIGQMKLITEWLDKMNVKNYIINDDLTIDVDGHVYLSSKNLDKFPDYIQFNVVNGDFRCKYNSLTSLRGCPKHVKGYFYCGKNAKEFTRKDVEEICKVDLNILPYTYDFDNNDDSCFRLSIDRGEKITDLNKI